jgi:hypothetical protein
MISFSHAGVSVILVHGHAAQAVKLHQHLCNSRRGSKMIDSGHTVTGRTVQRLGEGSHACGRRPARAASLVTEPGRIVRW